jgi:hypothetical protein
MKVLLLALAAAMLLHAQRPTNEFFALDTAVVRDFPRDLVQRQDVELLASLGYTGLAVVVQGEDQWRHLFEKVIPWLDERKLKLYAVYSYGRVERGGYSVLSSSAACRPSVAGP